MQNHDMSNTDAPSLLTTDQGTDTIISSYSNTRTLVHSLSIYLPLLKRIIILGLSGGALFVFHQFAKNGRYQINNYGIILDTRTGASYRVKPGSQPDALSEPIPEEDTNE